jgi:hypothetical protein
MPKYMKQQKLAKVMLKVVGGTFNLRSFKSVTTEEVCRL